MAANLIPLARNLRQMLKGDFLVAQTTLHRSALERGEELGYVLRVYYRSTGVTTYSITDDGLELLRRLNYV